MRLRTSLAIIAAVFGMSVNASAYIVVEDLANMSANAYHHLLDYAKYVQQVANQLVQIENQLTQVTQAYTALRRFGDPAYYVALLKLDELTDTIRSVSSIGQTISQYRQVASGLAALQYSANGIYSNLQNMKDNWGNGIRYDESSFRKFGAVQSLVEAENVSEGDWNRQMASLQNQLREAVQKLNSAGDLVSTEKYKGQIEAIHAEMTALSGNGAMKGRRLTDMHIGNQSDAARTQEAEREIEIQNRSEDLRREAAGFSALVGGKQ